MKSRHYCLYDRPFRNICIGNIIRKGTTKPKQNKTTKNEEDIPYCYAFSVFTYNYPSKIKAFILF